MRGPAPQAKNPDEDVGCTSFSSASVDPPDERVGGVWTQRFGFHIFGEEKCVDDVWQAQELSMSCVLGGSGMRVVDDELFGSEGNAEGGEVMGTCGAALADTGPRGSGGEGP